MKIALVMERYAESWGGRERYLASLSRGLQRVGHEVHLLVSRFEAGEADGGLRFHPVRMNRWGSAAKMVSFRRGARRKLAGLEADVVHALSRVWPVDVYRAGDGVLRHWLRVRPSGRLSARLRPFTWLALSAEDRLFGGSGCRHVIANSRLVRGQILSLYGLSPDRVSVVYNGVDRGRFHPGLRERFLREVRDRIGITEEDVLILFVSTNLRRKGLDPLIRSLALLREGVSLLVAGRGRPDPFLRLARELGVAGQVRFAGRVEGIERLYGASDIFALPTLYDPFANVCLEALAAGLPVITTSENGAAEAIEEGREGFVIPAPPKPEELAGRIRLLLDPERRREMSDFAARRARRFTPERNVRGTLEIYEEILRRKRSEAR